MKLTEVNIYPVKYIKGISLKHSKVEHRGLEFDRRWMLVNEKNEFLTQREFPKMATLEVEISEEFLFIKDKNKEIEIPFQSLTNETANVKIWSSKCRAQVYESKITVFNFEPDFLVNYLRQPKVRGVLVSKSGKVAITNINQGNLKSLMIPRPPVSEQREIARILATADKKIETEEKREAALEALFKTMLQQLMTGQIRVNELVPAH